jgi:hypothetical protein
MFELILNRLAATGLNDGASILSADEVSAWPQKEVAAYNRLRLLKKAAPAKTVECPGCEDACLMPVHVFPAQDAWPARIFVACDKREDTSRIPIEPATLEQWQIDIPRFACLLASALGTGHSPDEIIPKQVFYLGSLTINKKRRSAFFAANEEFLNSALAADLFRRYGQPFFLVAGGLNSPQEIEHDQTIISLCNLLFLSDNKSLSFDMPVLDQLISEENSRRAVAAIAGGEKGVEENIFRREGQMWTLCFGGVTKHYNHSKGLLYIAYLLGSPFQEYHVAEIVKSAESPEKEVLSFSSGEVSSKKTIANYRNRLSVIRAELSEADDTSDPLLKKELQEEKQAIEKQLLQAVGLGGKLKKHPDETKRQANAVSEAISRSLKVLDQSHPSLRQHLLNSINRGEYLSYTPEIEISWITIQ